MNEGFAEYTGVRLANTDEADRRAATISELRNAAPKPSLVRSFAYASGPAYGVLLDESGKTWRRTLSPTSDLGALLATAYHVNVGRVDEGSALAAARPYDGDAVIAAETRRADQNGKGSRGYAAAIWMDRCSCCRLPAVSVLGSIRTEWLP